MMEKVCGEPIRSRGLAWRHVFYCLIHFLLGDGPGESGILLRGYYNQYVSGDSLYGFCPILLGFYKEVSIEVD
jgi:hypothetical protein